MFTKGDKLRVMNTDSDVKVFNAAGAEVTTAAGVEALAVAGARFDIAGFGSFKFEDVVSIKCRRSSAVVAGSRTFTVVAPTSIAVGEAIEVAIRFKTSRYQGELTNNYIEGGRPIIFSTARLTSITANNIAAAIAAGWASYKDLFNMAELPIEVTNPTAPSANILVADATGSGSLTIESMEIRRSTQGIAAIDYTNLAVSATVVGSEGIGLGKFLEESVQMGTFGNVAPYGVDTVGTQVDLRGAYTQVSFTVDVERTGEDLSTLAAGHGPLTTRQEFTVWMNENTMLGTDGAVAKITEGFTNSTLSPNLTTVFVGGVSESAAGAVAEGLFLANGVSTTTSELFIA